MSLGVMVGGVMEDVQEGEFDPFLCWCGKKVRTAYGFCSKKCKKEFEEYCKLINQADEAEEETLG